MQNLILDFFCNVLDSFHEPLMLLDSELKVLKANKSYYKTFHSDAQTTEGELIYTLCNRQWDIPGLKELLEDILPESPTYNNFEVEQSFESIGKRIMHLNARRIYNETNQTQFILLAIEDISHWEYHRKKLEDIVDQRTAELLQANKQTERQKQAAINALSEVKALKERLEAERAYLQEEIKFENNHENIIGQSDGLKYVLYKVEQIAASDTTVLVLGETGTGKELVARAIHGTSQRKNHALVKVNCAALPSHLIESELFGHEKGAFTGSNTKRLGRFEVANGTTLFLDEIGELPLSLQSKLLRVLQDGEFERLGSSRTITVNARIIAATNRNLEEEVANGRFRRDLWYRLNIFPITMPPLRERIEDIPLLSEFYIKKISKRLGKTIAFIPQNVMALIQGYNWPGNVRELENVLERAVINSSGPKLHLVDDLGNQSGGLKTSVQTLEAVERDYIYRVLEQTHWKVSGKNSAAETLGLNRSTLRAKMNKLGIVKSGVL